MKIYFSSVSFNSLKLFLKRHDDLIGDEVLNDQVDLSVDWGEEMKKSKIWTTSTQNRLALQIEAESNTTQKKVRQVQRGDTLGAIVKGLTGSLDWSQSVDYKSSKLGNRRKPKVLHKANLIYPGQYVWVENGVIIVSDTKPATKPRPRPQPRQEPSKDDSEPVPLPQHKPKDEPEIEVKPKKKSKKKPKKQPEKAPSSPEPPATQESPKQPPKKQKPPEKVLVPQQPHPLPKRPEMTNWDPQLRFKQQVRFNQLEPEKKKTLNSFFNVSPTDRFDKYTFSVVNLPRRTQGILDQAREGFPKDTEIDVLGSRDIDIPGFASFLRSENSVNFTLSRKRVKNIEVERRGESLILLNFFEGNKSILKTKGGLNGDFTKTALLNEYSHQVTNDLVHRYKSLWVKQYVGKPDHELPSNIHEVMKASLIDGFSHPDIPSGRYNFNMFNELQSDCMSHSVYPESLEAVYFVYGQQPLEPVQYALNRDFVAFQLSKFLKENGHGNYTKDQINQAFRDYFNAWSQGQATRVEEIIDRFHFKDPAFYAHMQEKYTVVGEAFYAHLAQKIQNIKLTA